MRISRVESIPFRIKLKRPFREAMGTFETLGRVLVKVWTDEDVFGVGEVTANVPYDEERVETALAMVKHYFGPRIIGEDPFDVERIIDIMDNVAPMNLYAKAGIEVALYDIMGKAANLPVHKLIGGTFNNEVLGCREISIAKPQEMVREAVEATDMGFSILKVKIGAHPQRDVERFKAVREAVGTEVMMGADGNEGWRPMEAIKIIRKLEAYDLAYMEQPVSRWDIDGLRKVSRAVDTPIMADQSLRTLQEAAVMTKKEAVSSFNIKIGKQGGLLNSRKIASLAEAFNISLTLGEKFETGIGAAAGCHFAASVKNLDFGTSILDGPLLLEDDLILDPIEFKDGYVKVPSKPGLGIEIDEKKIKEFSKCF